MGKHFTSLTPRWKSSLSLTQTEPCGVTANHRRIYRWLRRANRPKKGRREKSCSGTLHRLNCSYPRHRPVLDHGLPVDTTLRRAGLPGLRPDLLRQPAFVSRLTTIRLARLFRVPRLDRRGSGVPGFAKNVPHKGKGSCKEGQKLWRGNAVLAYAVKPISDSPQEDSTRSETSPAPRGSVP